MAASGDDAKSVGSTDAKPKAEVPVVKPAPEEIIVHPIVLLSVVDHYNRVAKDTRKRVVGVLLGETSQGKCDVTTSFAVPFEEDPKDPSIWYLDHNFLEAMADMFRKVNSRERIVGFYSSGPQIRAADIELDTLFRNYHDHPCFVIVDVRPDVEGLPLQAYVSTEESKEGKVTQRTFQHVACSVGAHEPEEIGVEHLLRDVNDPSVSELAAEVRHKLLGLKGLAMRLQEMAKYLSRVLDGSLPVNHEILYKVQSILNLLPNLGVEKLVHAFASVGNDLHLAMYLSNLVRSITSLHDLVSNKLQYKDSEEDKLAELAGAKKPAAAGAAADKKGTQESKSK